MIFQVKLKMMWGACKEFEAALWGWGTELFPSESDSRTNPDRTMRPRPERQQKIKSWRSDGEAGWSTSGEREGGTDRWWMDICGILSQMWVVAADFCLFHIASCLISSHACCTKKFMLPRGWRFVTFHPAPHLINISAFNTLVCD